MKNHQLINQDSGNVEYYTDLKIIEAARSVMGGIDLDPASSNAANQRINANIYYTENDNGLSKTWRGRVWLNHPFSRNNNRLWIKKLIESYEANEVKEYCCITFAATSEKWLNPLLKHASLICLLTPRTNYFKPDGTKKKGVTKGSLIAYRGPNTDIFKKRFSNLGLVFKYEGKQ